MSKIYHCAQCGVQLRFYRKAVPKKGIILNLIAPHECQGEVPLEEFVEVLEPKPKVDMDKLFNSFPFVDKLNKAHDTDPLPVTDRRPKENLRKELSTTAPPNLVHMAKGITTSPAAGRELEEPNED